MVARAKKYSAPLIFFGNLAFLSWFVQRYAASFLAEVVGVNLVCGWLQKVGAALAFGNLGWLARSGLGQLAAFEAKKNPVYLAGFFINRAGSLAPPVFTIAVTWGRLHWLFVGYLLVDAVVALWAALHFERWLQETGTYFAQKKSSKTR